MKTASPFQVVLKLVLKWWWLMLIALALGAGVGYFIRSKQPTIYYARAKVWFGQDIQGGTNANSFESTQGMILIYSGLVYQERILKPVIANLNLGITVADLQGRMAANADPALPILEIVVADTNGVKAADIANAIAQQMINDSPTETISEDIAFKREQLSQIAAQINAQQTEYDSLVAQGTTLSSAFERSQNLTQQNTALANIRELQKLYADMSAGMPDSSSALQLWDPATAENAFQVAGSFISVILSGVAGLAVSIATIVLIAFLDDRLQWNENLEEVQGVRVLGPLGIIPKSKLPLYVESMPDAIEAEMLRQLRAKIVLAAGNKQPKVLTVTSYDSGDGKTVTAANLAVAASMAGLRTVLVDADIRKGDLHEIFRLPNVMGLSDILAGRDNVDVLLSRALLSSGYDNLTVLTSGRSTADPAALVQGTRLVAVLDILKQSFDTVIVDTVPTIGGADTAFVAELSDGVVIVLHGQRTTEKALRRTLQNIRRGEGTVNIFGVAFNRIPLQVTSSFNQPYYRRTLAISPEKLNAEILGASNSRTMPRLTRNVMIDKDGSRLFSLAAASVQLGTTEKGLLYWISAGYLKVERRGIRRWVRESELNALLERLPRHDSVTEHEMPKPVLTPSVPQAVTEAATEPAIKAHNGNKPTSGKIADLLRGQRDALLAAAREPAATEPKEE